MRCQEGRISGGQSHPSVRSPARPQPAHSIDRLLLHGMGGVRPVSVEARAGTIDRNFR